MQVGILKTDGGPHSAADWARVTASQIIDIASSAPEALVAEARAFEASLIALLTGLHDRVQKAERHDLNKKGPEHLASVIDTSDHHDDALGAVMDLAMGTSFEDHFKQQKPYLAQVIHEHFHHSMHVERSWHADKHPEHKASKAFRHEVIHGRLGAYAGDPKGEK